MVAVMFHPHPLVAPAPSRAVARPGQVTGSGGLMEPQPMARREAPAGQGCGMRLAEKAAEHGKPFSSQRT